MTRMLVAVALTWVLVWSLGTAWAHPLAPLGLTLRESEDGQAGHLIVATLKQPRVQQRGGHFAVRLAPACRVESTTTHDALESVTTITHHRCAVPLAELSAAIDGLSQADVDAVVTFVAHDGDKTQILLADDADHATLGGFESTSSWRRPVAAGFEHLWGGLDHVLLLVGLVLLERRWRPLLLSLTAFTVGHALSLGATVAGWIAPATRWTEVAIAATLLWLAFRLVARNASSPKREGAGGEDGRAVVRCAGRRRALGPRRCLSRWARAGPAGRRLRRPRPGEARTHRRPLARLCHGLGRGDVDHRARRQLVAVSHGGRA